MAITVNYPAMNNTLMANFAAYKDAVDSDAAVSVVTAAKKALDESLKAHNQSMADVFHAAILTAEAPLLTLVSVGLTKRIVCKSVKELGTVELQSNEIPVSIPAFLGYAKKQKVDVGVDARYKALFAKFYYGFNARVTKDIGGDTSKFKQAFGIVPKDFVGDESTIKNITSNTQLTKLLTDFVDSLGLDAKVNNYDLGYALHAATKLGRDLGQISICAEGTFWRIVLDILRKALNIQNYSIDYKGAKKAKEDAPKADAKAA